MIRLGHDLRATPSAWMEEAGVDSVTLLCRRLGAWRAVGRWGVDVGEAPWGLLGADAEELSWGGSLCKRVPELRATGQRSAALIRLAGDRMAWLSSARVEWKPGPGLRETLELLAQRAVSEDQPSMDAARASTAAHDIRNQLSLALLRLEMLDGEADEDKAPLRGALRAGRSMCNAFLEGACAHADFALRPVLEDEIRGALDSSGRSKLGVALRCGSKLYVHSSESAVRRFTQNALSNALAVAPDGARLRVEALSAGPGRLELAVEDDGAGLGPDRVQRAFRPRASGRGSTGLGTESILQAAQDLGSALKLETAPGEGSRLSVTMAAARSDHPVAVLLDGDPSLRSEVCAKLESLGWWVVQADGVQDAVGGVDRWGAELLVTRRGSGLGPHETLTAEARDLDVEVVELRLGDAGASLRPSRERSG